MPHTHIVGRFDKDLGKIKDKILDMGELVIAQIKGATDALARLDEAEADRLIAGDRTINSMNDSISALAERLIALRQPMALDLREALSPINISGELERIGDHAKSTAKRAKKLGAGAITGEPLDMLLQMSAIVQQQIADVLVAYRDSDVDLAALIRERDQQVDDLNKALFNLVVELLGNAGGNAETLVHVALIARNFERVGDHVANMAHYVNHIVTGDDS